MSDSVCSLPLNGANLAVPARCHVRQGARFLATLLPRPQGVDPIVTLGDMGDRFSAQSGQAGLEPTFLRLKVTSEGCYGQFIWAV